MADDKRNRVGQDPNRIWAGGEYEKFLNAINKGSDFEIAQEMKVHEKELSVLRERLYQTEAPYNNIMPD